MKVYAVQKYIGGDLELVVWPSIKDFESKEEWCDERFIAIRTYTDLCDTCCHPHQNSMVVYTADQIAANNILYGVWACQQP